MSDVKPRVFLIELKGPARVELSYPWLTLRPIRPWLSRKVLLGGELGSEIFGDKELGKLLKGVRLDCVNRTRGTTRHKILGLKILKREVAAFCQALVLRCDEHVVKHDLVLLGQLG